MMAWSLSVDAANAPLIESKVKQVGLHRTGNLARLTRSHSRNKALAHPFVLEVVLELAHLFDHFRSVPRSCGKVSMSHIGARWSAHGRLGGVRRCLVIAA